MNKKRHKESQIVFGTPDNKISETSASVRKPHLLIYAHYYELASTAQIIRDLTEGMLDTFRITVICVVPSYLGTIEDKWKSQKYYRENINGVDVLRVRVPEFTKTNKMSRVKNILAYFFRAIWATGKVKNADYVMSVSQPPILGGLLGVFGKKAYNGRYVYQIQDFNPEQVLAVKYSKNKVITDLMMWFDKFSCKHADLVITVGRDLIDTLNNRFKGKTPPNSVLINNWIDESEIYPLEDGNEKVEAFKKKYDLDGKFVIMYSGNIGLYYDLERLIKVMKQFRKGYTLTGVYESGPKTVPTEKYPDGREVVFAFVGAGSVLDKLILYAEKHHFENIRFIPYQDKKDLIYSLNAGDVHWCVNAKGIKGVSVPSKAYGIMAVGKPILGVLENNSEARLLIEEIGCGICCEPGDYVEVADEIRWFIEHAEDEELKIMGQKGREYLVDNLTKDISIEKYKEALLGC